MDDDPGNEELENDHLKQRRLKSSENDKCCESMDACY
jgi:hypothetical protein